MQIKWTKNAGDLMTARAGPFSLRVQPQGDGRWSWQVYRGDPLSASGPTAQGIARSLNAAKTVVEQFVMRSGLV